MYQAVRFNRGAKTGGGGVNVGYSLSPPSQSFYVCYEPETPSKNTENMEIAFHKAYSSRPCAIVCIPNTDGSWLSNKKVALIKTQCHTLYDLYNS